MKKCYIGLMLLVSSSMSFAMEKTILNKVNKSDTFEKQAIEDIKQAIVTLHPEAEEKEVEKKLDEYLSLIEAARCGKEKKVGSILKGNPLFVNSLYNKILENNPLFIRPLHGEILENNSLLDFEGQQTTILQPPLIVALKRNQIDVVKVLLENRANPDIKCDGKTALIHAVTKGFVDVVEVLLENGANPDITCDGKTALMHAVIENQADVVKMLLENKADPDIKCNGETPVMHALLRVISLAAKDEEDILAMSLEKYKDCLDSIYDAFWKILYKQQREDDYNKSTSLLEKLIKFKTNFEHVSSLVKGIESRKAGKKSFSKRILTNKLNLERTIKCLETNEAEIRKLLKTYKTNCRMSEKAVERFEANGDNDNNCLNHKNMKEAEIEGCVDWVKMLLKKSDKKTLLIEPLYNAISRKRPENYLTELLASHKANFNLICKETDNIDDKKKKVVLTKLLEKHKIVLDLVCMELGNIFREKQKKTDLVLVEIIKTIDPAPDGTLIAWVKIFLENDFLRPPEYLVENVFLHEK